MPKWAQPALHSQPWRVEQLDRSLIQVSVLSSGTVDAPCLVFSWSRPSRRVVRDMVDEVDHLLGRTARMRPLLLGECLLEPHLPTQHRWT